MQTYFNCCVLSFLWLHMANLSDFVGFALTVTRRLSGVRFGSWVILISG